ncbi:MAG: alpha/beta hydrolase fold domain-containing protein [Candidatus Melainabacteria bacterium]|nr:alpha/beta hydrolase fold domain-containing protein [Candidatus Melainabacteria bacterium]
MKKKALLIFFGLLLLLSLVMFPPFWKRYPLEAKIINVLIHTPIERQYPANINQPVDLVFYFQGAGNDESLLLGPYDLGGFFLSMLGDIYRKDLVFVSFGYDTYWLWPSPKLINETLQEVHTIVNKFNTRRIKFAGVSLGGSVALNLLSQADQNIKSKVSEVLAIFPITDFKYNFLNTKRDNVKSLFKKHFFKFKDPYEQMRLSSPLSYINGIPDDAKITLVEGALDTHVPKEQIEFYFNKLKTLNKQVKLVTFNSDHKPVEQDFLNLIKAFLK